MFRNQSGPHPALTEKRLGRSTADIETILFYRFAMSGILSNVYDRRVHLYYYYVYKVSAETRQNLKDLHARPNVTLTTCPTAACLVRALFTTPRIMCA